MIFIFYPRNARKDRRKVLFPCKTREEIIVGMGVVGLIMGVEVGIMVVVGVVVVCVGAYPEIFRSIDFFYFGVIGL